MIGFRVFDVGLLVIWLIWFFRLRSDDDDPPEDEGGGGGGPGPADDSGPGGGGGMPLPGENATRRWRRTRDGHRPRRPLPRRGVEPIPHPAPARVRLPATPEPAHRR